MELTNRPRRLRTSPVLRKMVRETRMDKSSLIYPMFVREEHKGRDSHHAGPVPLQPGPAAPGTG